MKKSRLLGAVCACILSFVSHSSNATTVVDTGPAPPGVLAGFSLSSGQWLSAQFTTDVDYTISSVEGWISLSEADTFGTVAIYSNSNDEKPGAELFSAEFEGQGRAAAWLGASGLSWHLPADTYWVSFEARAGQLLHASMTGPVPNPLSLIAWSQDQAGTWTTAPNVNSNFGVRIQAVPIPPALWLFGSGLLGLVGVARRKKLA